MRNYTPTTGFGAAFAQIPLAQAEAKFRAKMLADGFDLLPDHIEPGRLIRFPGIGKKRGNTAGWCKLLTDGRGGVYGDFSAGFSRTWRLGGGKLHIDEATRREIEEARRQRQTEIEARHAKKAIEAQAAWDRAKPYAVHPYLARKGIKAHGLRSGDWFKWIETPNGWRRIVIKNALLVPMHDETGKLWNLQAIFPEVVPELGRDKDFLGGRKAGLFFVIGDPTDTLLIAEGYATAATVHESTGFQTYIAFDCGNLLAVAQVVRKLHPEARIIITADNDRHTPGNPGLTKARAAALAVHGTVSTPEFPEGVPGSDWNDLAQWRRNHG